MLNLVIFILVFLLAWILVGVFSRWSKGRAILDVPNDRSSHEVPTPVGGGVVIVALTILPLVIWEVYKSSGIEYWGFYIGGILIAGISWIDDIRHIPAPIRFLVHIIAAVLVVWSIGPIPGIEVYSGYVLEFGSVGGLITILWIGWMTNAYNFMDGIDGLAGAQAVVAGVFWALCGTFFGVESITILSVALFASSLGFLVHNWPPAKVFMGDVGSAFLGFTFACIPLYALSLTERSHFQNYLPLLGLAAVWFFFADTIITFLRRLVSGEKLWAAHRRHLYQELIKSGVRHINVTLLYGVLMILVCVIAALEILTGIRGLIQIVAITLLGGLFVVVYARTRNAESVKENGST